MITVIVTAGIIDEFLDNVQGRIADFFTGWFSGWFAWMHDPLLFWTLYFIPFVAVLFVIGWFFPFKWVRATLGFLLLLVGAFMAGGIEMHRELSARRKEIEAKKKQKNIPVAPVPRKNDSWF